MQYFEDELLLAVFAPVALERFVEVCAELKLADDVTDFRSELKALEAMVVEDLQPFGERGYNRKPVKR